MTLTQLHQLVNFFDATRVYRLLLLASFDILVGHLSLRGYFNNPRTVSCAAAMLSKSFANYHKTNQSIRLNQVESSTNRAAAMICTTKNGQRKRSAHETRQNFCGGRKRKHHNKICTVHKSHAIYPKRGIRGTLGKSIE